MVKRMNVELIEIKAHAPSLDSKRKKIEAMGARKEGTFHQTDTYFATPSGRLKLREMENRPPKLIYYDRKNQPDPKKSDILLHNTGDPETLKTLLAGALGVKIIVEKTREIYHYQGTQIHLDTVEALGTFIEFERPLTNPSEDREVLESLMRELDIDPEDLITGSYCDLKMEQEQNSEKS